MGQIACKVSYKLFEIMNEIFVAIGAGPIGIVMLLRNGVESNKILKAVFISTFIAGGLLIFVAPKEAIKPSKNQMILITGCDSGLGYSLAYYLDKLGYSVLAGCLSSTSKGAEELRRISNGSVKIIGLDVTQYDSVAMAQIYVKQFIKRSPQNCLHAIINNAGVMVFGEFEWLTEGLIRKQVDVNFLGTLRVISVFSSLIRQQRARILNISSHCALSCLPGLSVYGATKSALKTFNDGLRVELKKYGAQVITIIPGSFAMQSNIMANHSNNVFEMKTALSAEQIASFGDYFHEFNSYLNVLAPPKFPTLIDDPKLYKMFKSALTELNAKSLYINEPIHYTVYHFLFKFSPICLRDYLVTRFMKMPKFKQGNNFDLHSFDFDLNSI